MMIFLLYTIVGWLATASMAFILYISIQPGQWLDKLLHWQDKLHEWDLQGREFIVKAGGMCELCFSHMIAFVSYWVYLFFMHEALHSWVTSNIDNVLVNGLANITWYLVYVSISANLSLYFITKLYRR